MNIIGISAYYHDSAAALIQSGRIVAAAQEERFSRRKHDARFPGAALKFCLTEANLSIRDIDCVVYYEQPMRKFQRLLKTYLSTAPAGFTSFATAMPLWLQDKLSLQRRLVNEITAFGRFDAQRLLFTEHHLSHAASAFYPSPFTQAAILVIDGVGEDATTSIGVGEQNQICLAQQLRFPHSLGLLYAAFTYYLGFKVNSGEYKVMGLAPYGVPIYVDTIFQHLIDLKTDGSFRVRQEYFNYCTGLTMTNARFADLFGGPRRAPESLLTQRHFDIAASIQVVTEHVMLALTRHVAASVDSRNLCMAGGVALNCVANGKILNDGHFDRIWIQPAAGDAGNAIGAALWAYHQQFQNQRQIGVGQDAMAGSYLGPQYSAEQCQRELTALGAVFEELTEADLIAAVVEALSTGKVVGWFQGRMEYGPRALGARSILADPRQADMQKVLNLKVKFRESFRPFAPSVLAEDVADWFELDTESPYMQLVAPVKQALRIAMTAAEQDLFGIDKLNVPRSSIPAVTHVDYSARVQTVHAETNPLYYQLLSAFKQRTGCPVLVNTSFNVRGEPIVNTPEQAFTCFMTTGIDLLAIGSCLLYKNQQTTQVSDKPEFAPD